MKRLTYTAVGFAVATVLALAGVSVQAQQITLQKAVVANGGGTSGNASQTLTYTVGQSATGTATNGTMTGTFGFWNTSAAISGVETGGVAGAIAAIEITPNPVTGNRGTLRIRLASSGDVEVQLYDALGRQRSELFNGRSEAGTLEVSLSAEALTSGSYFVAVRVPGGLMQRSFTVVR